MQKGKKTVWKRIFAIILLLTLTIQQTEIVTYADETGTEPGTVDEVEIEDSAKEDNRVTYSENGTIGESEDLTKASSLDGNATIEVTVNIGESTITSEEYARDQEFTFTISWSNLSTSSVYDSTYSKYHIVYYQIPDGITINGITENILYTLYDTSQSACGYYYLDGHTVYFFIADSWIGDRLSVSGSLSFKGTLSSDLTNNNDSVSLSFPGVTNPITINLEDGKVTGDKSYKINSDGSVTFTITFTVTGEDATVNLIDTLGSSFSFVSGSFGLDGTNISNSVSVSENIATATLSNLGIGTHTFTYNVIAVEGSDLSATSNKVEWTWETDNDDNPDGNGEKTSTVWVNQSSLYKGSSGKLDDNGNLIITWTITVTPDSLSSVDGTTITDTLGTNQSYCGNIVVKRGDNDQVYEGLVSNFVSDGKLSLTFNNTIDSSDGAYSAGQKYVIVYQTIVSKDNLPSAGSSTTYSNTVEWEEKSYTGTYTYSPAAPNMVSKSGEVKDQDNPTITWTVTIDPSQFDATYTEFTLTDSLMDYTSSLPSYVKDTLVVKTDTKTLTAGTDYIITWYTQENNRTPEYFTITFIGDYATITKTTEKIYVIYDVTYSANYTTLTGQNEVNSSYKYNGIYNTEKDEGYKQVTKTVNTSMNFDKTGTLSENVADWKILVNYDETYDHAAADITNSVYTITDVIPEGMTLDKDSVSVKVYNYFHTTDRDYTSDVGINVSYASDTRTLTITIDCTEVPNWNYGLIFEIDYSTTIDSTSITSTENQSVSYTNNAALSEGSEVIGTDTATVELESTILTKDSAETDSSIGFNQVTYTIGVNYGAQDLNPNSDTLTLTDTLDTNATLVLDSISVTDMITGEKVTYSVSYNTDASGNEILTLTIPDSRALIVTYRASYSGKEGSTVTIGNTAELSGSTPASADDSTSYKVKSATAWVHGESGSITITKVDANSLTTTLEGATFELYKVEDVTTDTTGTKVGEAISTNSSGQLKFTSIAANTLYYYVETSTVTGYQLDKTEHYFVLTDDSTDSAYTTLATNCKSAGITFATYPLSNGASITVSNKKETGSLEVKKTITGLAIDNDAEFTFVVTLTDDSGNVDTSITGTYGEMYFEAGKATFKLKNNESIKATDLPDGVGYTVTESSDDYTTTYTVNGTSVTEAKGTISSTASVVEVTNTIKTGELVISKTVSGPGAETDKDFTFTVKLENNNVDFTGNVTIGGVTFTDGVAKITLKHDESKTISGLPEGTKYTVTENTVDNYTTSVNGTTGNSATGTIDNESVSTASFTNTHDSGSLTVSKTVSGSGSHSETTFNFTVTLSDTSINGPYGGMTFKDGVAEVEIAGGASVTATGLPTGITYKVEEDDYTYYSTTSTGEEGTITTTESTASFTNTYQDGSLKVSKTVTGGGSTTKKFSFTVELEDTSINGTYGEMIFKDGKATFELADGESATATGLPVGIKYKVTEGEYASDGYATTEDGDSGTIKNGVISEAKFTNDYTHGILQVKKTVTNYVEADKLFEFTVTLSDTSINGEYADMTFTNGVAKVYLKAGESKYATGLPEDITYKVEETSDAHYDSTSTGATGTISSDTASLAEFTNTHKTGDLTVSKKVNGIGADITKKFTFTITLSDTSISATYGDITFDRGVATVELAAGNSVTAKGLPIGITYTVTESPDADYTTSVNGSGTNAIVGTISTSASDVEFTNTYITKTGDLTVTKKVTGIGADTLKEFTFTVKLSDTSIIGEYGDMTFDKGVATFELSNGESASAEGLPIGITYTVEETADDDYTTTYTGGEITDNSGTITAAGSNVTVTNTKVGTLTISKYVKGTGADTSKEFTFTITLYDEKGGTELTGSYAYTKGNTAGNLTSGSTISLKHGESLKISDLPVGTYYVVTEEAVTGYTESNGGTRTGTVETDESAVFTNTYTKVEEPKTPSTPKTSTPSTPTSPQTGEDNYVETLILLILSAGCMLILLNLQRRRREDEE